MDDGALIHEKGLMVRNIYNDLFKTSDNRNRMEVEKYSMLGENVRQHKAFRVTKEDGQFRRFLTRGKAGVRSGNGTPLRSGTLEQLI
jgi:hypothetical protein